MNHRLLRLVRTACPALALLTASVLSAQNSPSISQPTEAQSLAVLAQMAPPLPPDAPQPSMDPQNFEGAWFHDEPPAFRIQRDMFGRKLPFSSKGQQILDRRIKATQQDATPYSNASSECRPPGQPWQLDVSFPFQIFQGPHEIDFVFELYHGVWKIRMNQPHLAASATREYMGDSVGHWEGSTLVVDTRGYKQGLWLDNEGTPASRDAHLVHRIRKFYQGGWRLEILTTVDDPQMYGTSWTYARSFGWRPDMASFLEYDCERQAGIPGMSEQYGLIAEPADEQDIP